MERHDLGVKIDSPKLKHVLDHWCETRENRLMPSWEDIRPAAIKAALPIVWSYRYDIAQDEFFGGFAGDSIQRLLGGPIKDAHFRRVYNADPHFFARAKKVLFAPAIFLGRGLLFRQRERQCYGERMILPFSGRAGRADGIIGATDYKFAVLYKSDPEACGEVEQWFDLRASAGAHSTTPAERACHVTDAIAAIS